MKLAIFISILIVFLVSCTTTKAPQPTGENLLVAAREGQTDTVRALLKAGVDVNG